MLKKQIKFLRLKNGWSQVDLATRLNISSSTIGMYEQGRREPPIDILVAMSKEFDVSIDYLITGIHRISAGTEINLVKERNVDAFSTLKNLSREELIVLLAAQMMGQ